MKQTKKLTRNQREFLIRRKIDSDGVRVVEETNDFIKVQKPDGTILVISKQ